MTRKLEHNKYAVELCEILGEDPNSVSEITVRIRPHEPFEIVIAVYPTDTELAQLVRLMRRVRIQHES